MFCYLTYRASNLRLGRVLFADRGGSATLFSCASLPALPFRAGFPAQGGHNGGRSPFSSLLGWQNVVLQSGKLETRGVIVVSPFLDIKAYSLFGEKRLALENSSIGVA